MELKLPPAPKTSGVVEVLDLAGVTTINAGNVKFIINDKVVGGDKDALILRSFHRLDPEFKKKIIGGHFLGQGPISGEVAWEITRQIGLGAALALSAASSSATSSLSLAPASASPPAAARARKATAKGSKSRKKKSKRRPNPK